MHIQAKYFAIFISYCAKHSTLDISLLSLEFMIFLQVHLEKCTTLEGNGKAQYVVLCVFVDGMWGKERINKVVIHVSKVNPVVIRSYLGIAGLYARATLDLNEFGFIEKVLCHCAGDDVLCDKVEVILVELDIEILLSMKLRKVGFLIKLGPFLPREVPPVWDICGAQQISSLVNINLLVFPKDYHE